MRKLIVFIVAVLYLALASGATMHVHYCMGKRVDAGLYLKASKTCGKCGMEKKADKDNGCCKDEHKFVQADQASKAANHHIYHLQALSALAVFPPQIEMALLPSALAERFPICHAPPRQGSHPIYLANCVFRI